jgi:ribosomal protein S18 acetylase RimI-like enzyme
VSAINLTKNNTNYIETATLTKRMDGARYTLIRSINVLTPVSIDLINEYIGADKEPEDICDQAIRNCMLPKLIHSTPIYIVEARDSGLSREAIRFAVTQIGKKELNTETIANLYLTKEYYEKSPAPPYPYNSFHLENALLVKSGENIIGFLIAKIKKQHDNKDISNYYVIYLAVDSSFKHSGFGTQLLLTAMGKAHALKMPLGLTYYSGNGVQEKTRTAFYEGFTPKFGIPMHNEEDCGMCYPIWYLEGVNELRKY